MKYQKHLQQYRVALETADFTTIERLWQEAVHDPGLAAKLLELEHAKQQEIPMDTLSPTLVPTPTHINAHTKGKSSRYLLQVAVLTFTIMSGVILASVRPDKDGVHIQTLANTETPTPVGSGEIITAENANRLTQLGQTGKGYVGGTLWTPEGKTLIVYGSLGLDFYSVDNLTKIVRSIPTSYVVTTAALSRDGKLIVVGGSDGKIRGLDLASGTVTYEIQAHDHTVQSLAVLPDGDVVSIGTYFETQHSVYVWNVAKERERLVLGFFTQPITALAVSPDGQIIAASGFVDDIDGGTEAEVILWNAEGKRLTQIKGTLEPVNKMEFDATGSQLAMTDEQGHIYTYKVPSSYTVYTHAPDSREDAEVLGGIADMHYSSDGSGLITLKEGARTKLFTIWDTTSFEVLESFNLSSADEIYTPIAFSVQPTGEYLAVTDISAAEVKVFSLTEKKYVAILSYNSINQWIAIDSAGKYVAIINEKTVQVRTIDSFKLVATLDQAQLGENTYVLGFHTHGFIPGTTQLLLGIMPSHGGTQLMTWDFTTGEVRLNLIDNVMTYSPNTNNSSVVYGVTGDMNLSVQDFVNNTTKVLSQNPESVAYENYIYMGLSADNRLLVYASASSPTDAEVYDVEKGEVVATLKGHSYQPYLFRFSPDGKWLTSIDMGHNMILWDTTTWQEVGYIGDNIWTAEFNAQSTLLATSSSTNDSNIAINDSDIAIWTFDTQGLNQKALITGHVAPIGSLRFTPEGDYLFSASLDGTIRKWGIPQ